MSAVAAIIWSMPHGVNQKWNVFAPVFIEDINNDGVRDMVVVNGGDTQYEPEVRFAFIAPFTYSDNFIRFVCVVFLFR